jgi:hypothetical protein
MLEIVELLTHFIATVVKLLKPGGVKVVMAETMVMKHQLVVMNRGKKRSPALVTRDRCAQPRVGLQLAIGDGFEQ